MAELREQLSGEQIIRLNCLRALIAAMPGQVEIDGKKYTGFFEDVSFDFGNIPGGQADEGGFKIKIPIPDFKTRPEQGTGIRGRGQDLQILMVENVNDIAYVITAGGIVAEDA